MTQVSDRYRHLSDAFSAKIAAVPAARWDAPTPCPDWNVRRLVGHVIDSQGVILSLAGGTMGELPSVDDDPRGAFDAARAVVQDALDDPEVANKEFDGQMGRMTFAQAVDRFLCTDLVVHGWDFAHAAGLDDRIPVDEIERVRGTAESFGDAMRSPRAFGPAVDAAADADEQARLLAYLGRRA